MVGNDTASGNTAKAFLMSDKITPKGETARKREREKKNPYKPTNIHDCGIKKLLTLFVY